MMENVEVPTPGLKNLPIAPPPGLGKAVKTRGDWHSWNWLIPLLFLK
jgi:hypothetical protein